ncbi:MULTISPECIES: conjugal transfer protein [Streptacidiphilus]|uniref:Conjugal transfer protein n=1 Tax=Streptacidiphilus cavernicola TaxID=3342716 RepID=A0ABV6UWD6_9ACTN|nr:conjugal transfer protein [Streptacidiphilus jeojiense]
MRTAQPTARATAALDPAGFAQMFVSLWLRADASTDDARARALRSMAPGVALLTDAQNAQGARTVEQCAAVRSAQIAPGYWSVVVGVELDSGSAVQLRYFAVPVQVASSTGTGALGSLTVAAAPAEVGPAAAGSAPQTRYPAAVASDSALAASTTAFLSAYLTGSGVLSPLLSPGMQLASLPVAPYAGVQVVQVSADRSGLDGAVPADGTVAEVWVQVTATDPAGTQWPLQYALRMRARAGRWEVAALEPGPQLASTPAAPSTAPSVVPSTAPSGAAPSSSPSAS